MEEYQYTSDELKQLHNTLYEILNEIIRVCDKLGIKYFIIGGTGIGAFFWKGIIPWDDDIDIGMTRENYERFLSEAPTVLSKDYFLQWYKTDKHVPFFFAKVRKNNTLFVESVFKDTPIHHGIYVDIFPLDKTPKNKTLEKIQYNAVGFFNACFIAKELWQWRWCGKCGLPQPKPRGFLPCLLTRITNTLISKSVIYNILTQIQKLFNKCDAEYYNLMTTNCDHIPIKDIESTQIVEFGPLKVVAPSNLNTYLNNHYPGLKKHLPKEQQINHRPAKLYFGKQDFSN